MQFEFDASVSYFPFPKLSGNLPSCMKASTMTSGLSVADLGNVSSVDAVWKWSEECEEISNYKLFTVN